MAEKPDPADRPEPTLELPALLRRRRRPRPGDDRGASVPAAARSRRRAPRPVAAALAGGLVGILGAGLTWAAARGCDALVGTDSCGGRAGLLALLVIVVLMVLAGAVLLAVLDVPEPRSTSILGVGLVAVVALLVLLESLFSAWMFLVVPLVGAAAYGVAHWVTTRFAETPEEGPHVDVR